ncbi:hypothetical protein BXZ70DRAFT_976289 [Cristinia sonorae]|uniref:Chromo domain-containing protein n=1 Tax=Cristinia sonorae TaxID=1940300 RepID=A0A8K0XMH9_9AGAR|nr:hypothetical protein BXZ70DRAFT_976289 [Cristinia sonorae]
MMARTKNTFPQPVKTYIKTIPVPSGRDVSRPGPAKGAIKTVSFAGQPFPVSPILDTFFWYMAERHRIHQLRCAGQEKPWSKDDILNSHCFTNVFRVYDRTTQYILRNVIQKGSQDLYEVTFRVLLFRFFNRPETWEYLEEHLGNPTLKWSEFDVGAYDRVLSLLVSRTGSALYGAAYICPAPPFGWPKNHSNHLRLVQLLMNDDLPKELVKCKFLKDAHGRIGLYPSIGDFIGFQLLLDLNMSSHFKWSEQEWAALGPGSSACLRKMFGPSIAGYEQDAIRYLYESQESHFARLGITRNQVPRLCEGRPAGVSAVDIEHSLCECEKYSRGRFPHIKGKRTQVGRTFKASSEPITTEIPEHWKYPVAKMAPPLNPPPALVDKGQVWYEVSHIVAEKKNSGSGGGGGGSVGKGKYLVRWVGYGPEDDWWQEEKDLENDAPVLLAQWTATKNRIAKRIAQLQL